MWSKVLEILNQRLEAAHRGKLIVSLMELRDSMHSCHRDYQAVLEHDPDFSERLTRQSSCDAQPPSEAIERVDTWGHSVYRMHQALDDVNSILQIFDGTLHYLIAHYVDRELGSINYWYGSRLISKDSLEAMADPQFQEIISGLDGFIRQNFTLDEIYRADEYLRKSRGSDNRLS